jgi:stearoyl-CoA desaturase (delta-9 desaturase)
MTNNETVVENKQALLGRLNWLNTGFLISAPLLVAVALPSYIYQFRLDWRLIALFFFYYMATGVSITAGYHRLFSHRSYEVSRWVKLLYLIFGAAALEGSVLKWCTDHRRHHKFVDTEEDPYSIKKGFSYAHIGWVFLKEDPKYSGLRSPDLEADPLVAWQNRNYFAIAIITGFLLPALIGLTFGSPWGGVLFGGFLRVVVTHHCTFFINSLCHMWGSQPYGDKTTAKDNFVLAFLTYGEGYHNFHHRFEGDFRNGLKWYQWDPTKWLIQLLSLTGSARNLRKISESEILKARLGADEKKLIQWGFYDDSLRELKKTIEDSQKKIQQMKQRYQEIKSDIAAQKDEQLQNLRYEIDKTRSEFNLALQHWQRLCRSYRERVALQST